MTEQHTEQPTEKLLSPWRRLTLEVPDSISDVINSILDDEGALGVEIEDDETRAVPGKTAVLTGTAVLCATFSRVEGMEEYLAERIQDVIDVLNEEMPELELIMPDLSWTDLYPEDWNAVFMSQWRPMLVGSRLWIVPSWEAETFKTPHDNDIVLHLDPGMAFGTGTHETTQLCMEILEEVCAGTPPTRLLDVGTGSGILAIAALKMGVVSAVGTDIDPVAVRATLENAERNGVGGRLEAHQEAPDFAGATFDAVIANILAGTLIELAEPICGAVAPNGALWLSGVLAPQAPAVIEAFEAQGMTHERTVEKNQWVRIDLRKKA